MHLSIEIPTPPPLTPGRGGGMWGIFMAFEGRVRSGVGGFLRICFTHSSSYNPGQNGWKIQIVQDCRSGSEVGIGGDWARA